MFKIGDRICYVKSEWSANVERRFVSRGHIVTKIRNSDATIWIDSENKPEDCLFAAFAYPDTDDCAAFMQFDLDRAATRKEEDNKRMAETYQFNNDLIRKGLK